MKRENWVWMPHAGHFILGHQCRFKLNTYVGKYIVSTVGEYLPDSAIREILALPRNIQLEGMGDAREADWMKKVGFENIGLDRKYETMVFEAGPVCDVEDCMCGMPTLKTCRELDFIGCNTRKEANQNHIELCSKWDKIAKVPDEENW